MSVLRVATINVWNKSGPWLSRLALIRRELERLAPEVVGLQEVLRFRPDVAPDAPLTVHNDQLTEIADGLGYQLAYSVASDYGHGLKFGNGVLSRHPIVSEQSFQLPGSESGETRSLLYALCQTPHGSLPVGGICRLRRCREHEACVKDGSRFVKNQERRQADGLMAARSICAVAGSGLISPGASRPAG